MQARPMLAAIMFAALGVPSVQAALPTGTLTFLEPTGTVQADASIDVWVRLTLDSSSAPLLLNNALPNYGALLADVDNDFFTHWLSINSAITNTAYECSGTFDPCSDSAPYKFHFNLPPSASSFNFQSDISLAPGQSIDYKFGTFVPRNGPVAPGSYRFFVSYATLSFQGSGYRVQLTEEGLPMLDAAGRPIYQQAVDESGAPLFETQLLPVYRQAVDQFGEPVFDSEGNPVHEQALDEFGVPLFDESGNPIFVHATDEFGLPIFQQVDVPVFRVFDDLNYYHDIARSPCGAFDDGCAGFTRTVLAVPEAETWAMMLAGLGLIGLAGRRRRV